MIKSLFMFSAALGLASSLSAMDSSSVMNPRSVAARLHYGYIIPHSMSIREISYSRPRGFQIEYSKRLNTQEAWDRAGCYPKVGLSFYYFDYDNPPILGHSYTLSGFVEPVFNHRKRLQPSFRMGGGVSYMDKVYHPVKNPENLFYSHPVSFYLLINLGINYQISDLFSVNLAGNYSHISNGRIRQPNKGINFPTCSFGIEYHIDPPAFEDRLRNKSREDLYGDLFKIDIAAYTARKEANNDGRKFQTYGVEVTAGYIVSRLSGLNAGMELTHDRSVAYMKSMGKEDNRNPNPTTASCILKHELFLGSFIFDQTLGIYLNKPYPGSHLTYQKIGLRYILKRNFNIGLVLKTHTKTADFVSLNLGYTI